jgi:hypothetical protein
MVRWPVISRRGVSVRVAPSTLRVVLRVARRGRRLVGGGVYLWAKTPYSTGPADGSTHALPPTIVGERPGASPLLGRFTGPRAGVTTTTPSTQDGLPGPTGRR